jgi:hypothetical protein
LNDRLFVDNEGLESLNYQEGDKFHPPQNNQSSLLQPIVTVTNVEIKNGRLGRASHAGIHGNGAKGVRINNMEIFDFEVSKQGSASLTKFITLCHHPELFGPGYFVGLGLGLGLGLRLKSEIRTRT